MRQRIALLAAVAGLLTLGTVTPPAEGAEAARTWCMTYCDAVHVGCKKTIGLLDQEACEEWHEGCLEGCRVNEKK